MPKHTHIPDLTGRIVDCGRLKLLSRIGSGSFGVVYRALDLTSPVSKPRYFAVKCLGPPSRRISRELDAHYECSEHPSIVTLHRDFFDSDLIFAVLDLMQGTMMQHVERGLTYVSDAALKSTFLQILDAVEHIHDNGLGHRDLKPENILCSEDGLTVKICDFGVAVDCERAHLSMAGSLPYMPPEVLELGPLIKSYSAAAGDVWACCILLLNMMGGRCPWKQADTGDFQFAMFLEDPLYLMATFRISEPLYRLLLRGLHQDPRYRPSVTELRRGIKKIKHFYKREPSDPLAFAAPFISKMKKLIVSKRSPPIAKPAVVVPAAASRPPPVTPVQLPPPMSRGELSLRPMVFKTVWSTPYGSEPPSAQPSWHRSDHGSSSPESDWVSVLSTFNSQAEVVFAPVGSVAMSACSSPLPWLKDDVPAPVAKLALLAPPSFSTASSSAPSQSSSSTRPSFANSELVSKYSTHGSGRFGLLRSWPQQTESA